MRQHNACLGALSTIYSSSLAQCTLYSTRCNIVIHRPSLQSIPRPRVPYQSCVVPHSTHARKCRGRRERRSTRLATATSLAFHPRISTFPPPNPEMQMLAHKWCAQLTRSLWSHPTLYSLSPTPFFLRKQILMSHRIQAH